MNFTFPLTAGLIAAVLHVLTGPDHLAAVAPFAIESKKKAWKIGLAWGIGHICGMMAIGGLFIFFKEFIPVEKISMYSEQLVGFVLIGIGAWAFYKIFKTDKDHKHLHIHSENTPLIHSHSHEHHSQKTHNHIHDPETKQSNVASFSIGFMHGLAGISHFLLFLPVLGFENQFDSMLYITGFGIGIVLAMVAFTLVIGKVNTLSMNGHNELLFKGIRLAGGIFAIIIGLYWIFSTS